MKVDLEQLKAMRELFGSQQSNTQPAVPVISVPQDHDSFASTRNALKENWIFLAALFGAGMWILNAINTGQTTDINQQNEINRNTAAISELKQFVLAGQTANQEIIRKLDILQRDVDILNGK